MKKIDVTHYKVNSDKVGAGLAIALVADLHCALFGQRQSDLTDLIRAKTPDLILMAGDIYHHFGKRENGHILIRECSEIARVYYTPGNHEKQNPDYKRILSEVAESGGIVLDNEAVITDVNGTEIVIAGGDESATIKKSLHIKDSNRERFRILVNHYPEQFRGFTEDFDLMTAGHLHGCIVRIPRLLPNGLYAAGQGFFPKYSGGIYRVTDDFTLIVSRGLSVRRSGRFRLFNRPELVNIDITK